jgi:UPF0148 protein
MSSDLTKKAVKMLLNGARMLSEPCPYCKGVRVMKDGYALCVNCGKEPEITQTEPELTKVQNTESAQSILENKLQNLSKELEKEKDHEKQQQILKSINSLVEILAKLKN